MELSGSFVVDGSQKLDFGKLSIHVVRSPSSEATAETILTKATPDGRLVIQGIYSGSYEVTVAGIPDNCYLKALRLDQKESSGGALDLNRTGPTKRDLDIVISPNGGRIDGVVEDDKNTLAGGAVVDLVPNGEWKHSLFRETVADSSGRFFIAGIAPGEYKLFAWEDVETGAVEDSDFLKPFENQGEAITIRENSRENRSLHRISARTIPQ